MQTWYDDYASLSVKADVARAMNLRGIGVWDLALNIWPTEAAFQQWGLPLWRALELGVS